MAPALSGFCGGLPLPLGILTTLFVCMLRAMVLLSYFSSRESVGLGGIVLSPFVQVVLAAEALAGVPMAVLAGFGVVFRMERHVQLLLKWLQLTLFLDTLLSIRIMASGNVCSMVYPYLVRRGPMFICLYVGVAVVFWLTVFLLLEAYLALAVWSQAEQLKKDEYERLVRYDAAGTSSGGAGAWA